MDGNGPEVAPLGETRVTQEVARQDIQVGKGRTAVVVIENYTGDPTPKSDTVAVPNNADEVDLDVPAGLPAIPSVANLCNSAIGAGMLSLPYAFMKTGLLGGVLMCSTIGVAEAFTLYVLSKMAERYGAVSYTSLVRATLGKKMATVLSILMIVYMWGACNAYLVIMGDTFSALGCEMAGPDSLFANRQVIIAGVGLGLLLPICFVRRLGALSALSSVAVIGFLYTSGVIIMTAWKEMQRREDPWKGVEMLRLDVGALFALPIVVFGFNCHANAVTIFHELTEEPVKQLLPIKSRRKTSKLVNMISVIIGSIFLIMCGYLAVGAAGYLAFTSNVPSNIINILPKDDPFVKAACALIGVVVAGHYPLNHHPARSGFLDLAALAGYSQQTRENILTPIFTVIFVVTNVILSLFVKDLGDVLHLIGGTVAALLIFFNPGFMLINAAIVKHSTARLDSLEEKRRVSFRETGDGTEDIRVPLLRAAVEKGIKKTGLVYSPGKSWAAGLCLATFAVFIMVTTVVTTFIR